MTKLACFKYPEKIWKALHTIVHTDAGFGWKLGQSEWALQVSRKVSKAKVQKTLQVKEKWPF